MADATDTIIQAVASKSATTTREEDRHSLGQRRVNLIWEATQAMIAISVIGTTLYVDGCVAIFGRGVSIVAGAAEVQSSALMQLNVMAALVTGFYFGRTNHQRVGGVGGGGGENIAGR